MTRNVTHLIPALVLAAVLGGPVAAQTSDTPAADAPARSQPQSQSQSQSQSPDAGTAADGSASPAASPPAASPVDAPADGSTGTAAAGSGAEAPAIDPAAPAGEYVFDQSHSQVVFSYDHMGMSTSHGVIRGVAGSVTLDPANPANSKVEAMFPLSAIQTIAPELDEHLGSGDFFAGAAPATAVTFTSTSVEPTGPDTARVTGDLLLNDVTRPVTLDVTLRRLGDHPMTGQPAAGFDITGTLKRSDFNLGAFAPAVGDEVTLQISVEAAKG